MNVGIVYIVLDVFALIASVRDWNWWYKFGSYKWPWYHLSRQTNRVWSIAGSCLLILLGILVLTGVIPEAPKR